MVRVYECRIRERRHERKFIGEENEVERVWFDFGLGLWKEGRERERIRVKFSMIVLS